MIVDDDDVYPISLLGSDQNLWDVEAGRLGGGSKLFLTPLRRGITL